MAPFADYSDLADDIENSQEPTVLEAGSEVKVRIIDVNTGVSDKNGCHWVMPVFDVPDQPLIKEFNYFMWELEKDKLKPKQYERGLNHFKNFAKAFGLDYSRPFEWEDLIDLEGWVIVGVKKDEEYGDKNTVKKFQTGP